MNKKNNIFLLFLFMFCGVLHAQDEESMGPVHSPKLDKENGFKKLVIGAKMNDIKSILQKTKLDPAQLRNAESFLPDYNTSAYLVDLKKGYSTFLGFKVDRIEVLFGPDMMAETENAPDAISRVTIYFKKEGENQKKLPLKLFEAYGGAYPVIDFPETGDDTILWAGENALMVFGNYYGSEDAPKRDFLVVSFSSAKGG
ncbi:MAG TPA: hypothetical protein VK177_20020 [Flavobacteriales bacterium]|nr:hypothetical protein [Flavobacteriales bacterium]